MNIQTAQLGTALKQKTPYMTTGAAQRSVSETTSIGQARLARAPDPISFWPTRIKFMAIFAEMKRIFSAEDMKKSNKREALKKSLIKLESKGETIRRALKDAGSKKKRKELETKLETNLRHQKKAGNLIKDLG